MSNVLAIATVTETLLQVLSNALLASQVSGAQVTVLRPDAPAGLPTAGVNIFLYQVTPNTAWRNADLTTRNADGSLRRRPQAALDLHYLLSFYGEDAVYQQQRLLGTVVRALHAAPTLDRAAVLATEARTADGGLIFASGLSDQSDPVRFTPVHFSLEELSKLWSVFLKTDYVLSLVYVASVVLIETDDPPPAAAPPVRTPSIQAVPLSLAAIDSVVPQSLGLPITGSVTITLLGRGLSGDDSVAFTTPDQPNPIPGTINSGGTSNQLTVTLPAGLRPGISTIQLTQSAPTSPPYALSQSNALSFVVLPTVVSVGPGISAGKLLAVVSPTAGPGQTVSLVLSGLAVSASAGVPTVVLPSDPHDTETGTFTFSTTLPGGSLAAGSYLVRVRVDAAESRLTVDSSGTFNGPVLTLS